MAKKDKLDIKKEKVPVTFSDSQIKMLEKYMGLFGNTKAEIVRNIVINWIIDKEKNDSI